MSDDSGRPWPADPRRGRNDPRAPLPTELDPRRGAGRDPARYGGGGGGYGPPPTGRGPGDGRFEPSPPDRTGRQRAGLAFRIIATGLSVTVLVASGVLWAAYRKYNGQITRINALPASGNSEDRDVDGKDMNILMVGNDSRDSATDAQLGALGTERSGGTANTDTMILVHVPADGSRASLVSFPRDLWVEVPGLDGHRKLNAAYPNGSGGGTSPEARGKGAQLLIKTISQLSGLRIDHYVEVDLLGFYNITNALDGIEVNLCKAQKEKDSGIDLPAGKQTIKGTQALSFVRQRKGLPNGDLDRIHRQQYFIGAVINKIISKDMLFKIGDLNRTLKAITKSLYTDQSFEPLELAQQMRDLAAGNVEFLTVPNKGPANVDGASVVLPDEDALEPFFTSLSDGDANPPARPKTIPRDQVEVEVLNGSGRGGLAGRTSDALSSAGFTVTGTDNAPAQEETTILYADGQRDAAATLATVVKGASLEADDSLESGVRLVLGSSFDELSSGGGGGSGGSSGGGSGGGAAGGTPTSPQPDRTAADKGCIN